MIRTNPLLSVLAMLLCMLLFSCGDEGKYNPPADHTRSNHGAMHKPGLDQPMTNCVSCHGSDLNGGTTGVSCFECHGKKW